MSLFLDPYYDFLVENKELSYNKLADKLLEKYEIITDAKKIQEYFKKKNIDKPKGKIPGRPKTKKVKQLINPYMSDVPMAKSNRAKNRQDTIYRRKKVF